MPVETLNFQGINRAISDFGSAGACEELINLRPTTAGLVPVKQFHVQMAEASYDKIFSHKVGSGTNYLAVKKYGDSLYFYHISDAGAQIGAALDIYPVSSYTHFSIDQIYYAAVGNIVLFSISNKEDKFFLTRSWIWDGDEYIEQTADIPAISVVPTITLSSATQVMGSAISTTAELVDTLDSAFNALQDNNPSMCFGPVLVAFAFKTKDGNTFWTWKWIIYDPLPATKEESVYIVDGTTAAADYDNYFDVFEDGITVATLSITPSDQKVVLYGDSISLTVSLTGLFDGAADIIKSVEVYASRPILYVDTDAMLKSGLTALDFINSNNHAVVIAPIKQYKEMALDRQLLYHQKTILMSELRTEGPQIVNLSFGGNIQTTDQTLEVDAGMVTRYGRLLSYNARFHYYDAVAKTDLTVPSFSYPDTTGLIDAYILLRYNDGQTDSLVYVGQAEIPEINAVTSVIAPSLNVKEVITYYKYGGHYCRVKKYTMSESSSYNYSYNIVGPYSEQNPDAYVTEYENLISSAATTFALKDEQDAINVTEQYNPFVFRVEHSYLAPGKVLDLQPQMVAVADVTYGDYPLNVFTNRGLYALLQGNGTVLYGAFRPVSNLVTTANSVPTESGTFFIAAGGLWLIAGSRAVLISDALSLGPHKFIRSNTEGYGAICNGVYHVEDYESKVSFEDYVSLGSGAKLAYNRYRDELFISNPDYDYCYVLSLKYRQWFKMTYKLEQDAVGDDIVKIPVSSGVWRVLDLSDEIEETSPNVPASVLVHLQSRPFSMGYQYIHVHRVVAMIRAALANADKLVVALYGSDDLQNWKLLSYADRADVQFSQIRTPSAARSWRYYTITIGGTTPVDTDFGTVMFEYQPVVRRIG